tara:strand:- start:3072 stop:3299 length:228 start_codon:yes stop_codon:yes gene_type:complete
MAFRDTGGRIIAGLILASMIGIPVAGYDYTTAGLVFIVHTATLVCLVAKTPPTLAGLVAKPTRRDAKPDDGFEMV